MANKKRVGAFESEWGAIRGSAVGRWAVPIVSNPTIPVYGGARLGGIGKIPSVKTDTGEIVPLKGWNVRPATTSKDIDTWSADPDIGFGVRLGHEGLAAIDCDCDDPAASRDILDALIDTLARAGVDRLPVRRRGTDRWATIIRVRGDALTKSVVKLRAGGKVEVLGAGQQLACCGTHPSGARYTWTGARISETPEITRAAFDAFMDHIAVAFGTGENAGTGSGPSVRDLRPSFDAQDDLADWLRDTGRVLGTGRAGEMYIECPWVEEHTNRSGMTATAYFPVGSNGYEGGAFKCMHAHCEGRTLHEFLDWAYTQGFERTHGGDFPVETVRVAVPDIIDARDPRPVDAVVATAASSASTRGRLARFRSEKTGLLDPVGEALDIAVADAGIMGAEYAIDAFAGGLGLRVRDRGGDWRDFEDEDVFAARLALEHFAFDPHKLSRQLIRDAIGYTARTKKIDTMCEYLRRAIPEWDGVPRIDRFFAAYCGAVDDEWSRAVSRYTWTALWARASCKSRRGVKADIVPVLVGAQGTRKSSLLRVMARRDEWCGEIDFEKSDDDNARTLCEKLVAEIPELGGMSKREHNAVKAFITRATDEWVPKYREAARKRARRCIFIMTTNDRQFLTDPTGDRRFAPIRTKRIDIRAVRDDIDKLWAEAREAYTADGIAYRAVEVLQDAYNEDFRLTSPMEDAIDEWLDTLDDDTAPITTQRIASEALGRRYSDMKRGEKAIIASAMRARGYESVRIRVGGQRVYVWQNGDGVAVIPPEDEDNLIPY